MWSEDSSIPRANHASHANHAERPTNHPARRRALTVGVGGLAVGGGAVAPGLRLGVAVNQARVGPPAREGAFLNLAPNRVNVLALLGIAIEATTRMFRSGSRAV